MPPPNSISARTHIYGLLARGELRSVKVGRNRRILPAWVDEYVTRCAAEAEGTQRWSA
jgi:excisionase family DNA binding protein